MAMHALALYLLCEDALCSQTDMHIHCSIQTALPAWQQNAWALQKAHAISSLNLTSKITLTHAASASYSSIQFWEHHAYKRPAAGQALLPASSTALRAARSPACCSAASSPPLPATMHCRWAAQHDGRAQQPKACRAAARRPASGASPAAAASAASQAPRSSARCLPARHMATIRKRGAAARPSSTASAWPAGQ